MIVFRYNDLLHEQMCLHVCISIFCWLADFKYCLMIFTISFWYIAHFLFDLNFWVKCASLSCVVLLLIVRLQLLLGPPFCFLAPLFALNDSEVEDDALGAKSDTYRSILIVASLHIMYIYIYIYMHVCVYVHVNTQYILYIYMNLMSIYI